MEKSERSAFVKRCIELGASVVAACCAAVFTVLYVRSADGGVLVSHGTLIEVLAVGVLCIIALLTVVFALLKKELLYKLGMICLMLLFLCATLLYVLSATGFWDKVDSVEDLREFIASYGGVSTLIFLAIQFLQVVVIPIPGVVTIGAGVLLFGPFLGAVLSFVGIMIGSVAAYFIGRCLGYKVVCWLVGKENLDKAIKLVKGKDRVILTFMFLFPFFPDDVLCFVSGLSSMSPKYFFVMITVTRIISTFTTAYSVNGSLIPYNTWWGILIWAVLIVASILLMKFVYKNSEKLENFFKSRKK